MPTPKDKSILLAAALLFPIVSWLAVIAKTNTDDPDNWIDKSSPAFLEFEKFTRDFGTGDEVIVTWQGCRFDNPQLPIIANALRGECRDYLIRVVYGSEALKHLVESASKFSELSARKRLRGSLFGDDLETTCFVLTISEKGRANLSGLIDLITETVARHGNVETSQVHLGGKAVNDHALNSYTNRSLWVGIPGAFLASLLAFLCIANIRLAIGMVVSSALPAVASLALVQLAGKQVNGLLVLMPVLVFILVLGCAVHMVRALIRELNGNGLSRKYAISKSLTCSKPPVILSLVTTAIGIASLAFSPLPAVFEFGLFTGISLILGLLSLLVLLPATWCSIPCIGNEASGTTTQDSWLVRLLKHASRYPKTVLLATLAISIPAVIGLTKFETNLETAALFAPSTQYSVDQQWIEKNLYPLGRVELVVQFKKADELNRFQQLQTIRKVTRKLREDPNYHAAISVANFVRIPRPTPGLQRQLTEQAIASQIDHDYQKLHDEGMLYSDDSLDSWRISVCCDPDQHNDELVIAKRLQAICTNTFGNNDFAPTFLATGLGTVAADGQKQLLRDLLRGLIAALMVITPLIMLSLRSVTLGIVAMLPNLLPIVVVFGYCGLTGGKLDIGAVLTASVGLGIAIDDTVHFLHYYQMGSKPINTKLQNDSVTFAIERCASSVATTSAIVITGLFLFAFCEFLAIRNFSICLMSMIFVAAVADLLCLPAILKALRMSGAKMRTLSSGHQG